MLSRKGLELLNLQRTLDNRELEIDMLEKDLFECREVIYNQMEARKKYEATEKQQAAEIAASKTENNNLKVSTQHTYT